MVDTCQICKQGNDCAIAMGCSAYTCWCMRKEVPKELTNIVAEDSCICENCIDAFNEGNLTLPEAFLKIYQR